jgi:hypothetical protein
MLTCSFGYVIIDGMCRLCTKICTNLLHIAFIMNCCVFMLDLSKWFLYLNKNIFVCPTSVYSLEMPRVTSAEFIMILELL